MAFLIDNSYFKRTFIQSKNLTEYVLRLQDFTWKFCKVGFKDIAACHTNFNGNFNVSTCPPERPLLNHVFRKHCFKHRHLQPTKTVYCWSIFLKYFYLMFLNKGSILSKHILVIIQSIQIQCTFSKLHLSAKYRVNLKQVFSSAK